MNLAGKLSISRKSALMLCVLALTGCAAAPKVYKAPSGNLRLVHDDGSTGGQAVYRIYHGSIRQPGEVKSIVTAAAVRNVPGLPVDQKIFWSRTGSTALIYENMSDASPEYQHVLVRERGNRVITMDKVDLGSRGAPGQIYAEWPTVTGITDTEIMLEWRSEPRVERVRIERVLSTVTLQ